MLTCLDVTEIVTDYLEGRMSFRDRVRFHMHLGMCRHCRAYLRQMRQTVKVLGHLPEQDEMPADVRAQLLARFKTWKAN